MLLYGYGTLHSIDASAKLTSAAGLCLAVLQLFWEAFPAEAGRSRTTYMFAYSGKHSRLTSIQ